MRYLIAAFLMTAMTLLASWASASTTNKAYTLQVVATGSSCPVSAGPLTLSVVPTRTTGISPLLVFFDATATTDSTITGSTTVFQDLTITHAYGDTGASGTGTWAYGSRPGVNSKNAATGGIGAHEYIVPDGSGDKPYTATFTAHDQAGNTATCTVAVTAYDASGSNGFLGTNTACVGASTTPVAGVGGCPASAAVLQQSNFATALASKLGAGKRVLFKCGDTFTGDNGLASAVGWSIGAYGSCVGTQTSRPILSDTTSNGNPVINVGGSAGDGRVSDIDVEAVAGGSLGVFDTTFNVGGAVKVSYQITINNVLANGTSSSFGFAQGAQWGLINSKQTGQTGIGVYFNYNENNPPYSGNTINNTDYTAALGNFVDGTGAPDGGAGVEVLRISACRGCVIENNTLQNANHIGGVLKIHEGNTNLSCMASSVTPCNPPCAIGSPTWPSFVNSNCWVGTYVENVMVTDNLFAGKSGANMVEFAPQSNSADERLRNIVAERNIYAPSNIGAVDGRMQVIAAANVTMRDNIFFAGSSLTNPPFTGVQIYQRGLEPVANEVEIYNNTCYWQVTQTGGTPNGCAEFATYGDGITPGINSYAKNNLFFTPSAWTTVVNNGTGNAVSNNTVTSTLNPAVTNASGTFSLITDFKPTANYSGGVSVPVIYDALGTLWSPTWALGAIHP